MKRPWPRPAARERTSAPPGARPPGWPPGIGGISNADGSDRRRPAGRHRRRPPADRSDRRCLAGRRRSPPWPAGGQENETGAPSPIREAGSRPAPRRGEEAPPIRKSGWPQKAIFRVGVSNPDAPASWEAALLRHSGNPPGDHRSARAIGLRRLGSRIAAAFRYSPRQLAGVPEQSGFSGWGAASLRRSATLSEDCRIARAIGPQPGSPRHDTN
jgi:hypothetical protein